MGYMLWNLTSLVFIITFWFFRRPQTIPWAWQLCTESYGTPAIPVKVPGPAGDMRDFLDYHHFVLSPTTSWDDRTYKVLFCGIIEIFVFFRTTNFINTILNTCEFLFSFCSLALSLGSIPSPSILTEFLNQKADFFFSGP